MSKNNHHGPSRALSHSQNFLTSAPYIRNLLRLSDISPQDTVLEIGPGKGHITRELLSACARVIAVEADQELYEKLRGRFDREPRLTLHRGDFLRYRLPPAPYKVFANIPFGLTTDILRRLTGPSGPEAAWLIVEWGAARRFAGDTPTGLRLRPFFQVRVAAKVPRSVFHPQPGVDAALLELKRRPQPDIPFHERGDWERFLRQGWRGSLTKKQASTALRLEGLPMVRDGNTMYVQWLCLFRCWKRFGPRYSKHA